MSVYAIYYQKRVFFLLIFQKVYPGKGNKHYYIVHLSMCIYIYIYTHTHTHTYKYIYIYIYIYIQNEILILWNWCDRSYWQLTMTLKYIYSCWENKWKTNNLPIPKLNDRFVYLIWCSHEVQNIYQEVPDK